MMDGELPPPSMRHLYATKQAQPTATISSQYFHDPYTSDIAERLNRLRSESATNNATGVRFWLRFHTRKSF